MFFLMGTLCCGPDIEGCLSLKACISSFPISPCLAFKQLVCKELEWVYAEGHRRLGTKVIVGKGWPNINTPLPRLFLSPIQAHTHTLWPQLYLMPGLV